MVKNKTIGQRIRELRLARKMTQVKLAKKAGLDFTYLSKIENAKVTFGERAIKKISRALVKDDRSYKSLYEELMLLNNKIPEGLKKDILKHKEEFLGELHRPQGSHKSLYRKYREMSTVGNETRRF